MRGGQGASEDTIAAEITPLPDDPRPLTDEEIAERERCAATSHAPCCVRSMRHASAPPARVRGVGVRDRGVKWWGNPCRLLDEGFASWNKRDFTAFTRAAEKFGRQALTEIARDIDGKTEDEVCPAPALAPPLAGQLCIRHSTSTRWQPRGSRARTSWHTAVTGCCAAWWAGQPGPVRPCSQQQAPPPLGPPDACQAAMGTATNWRPHSFRVQSRGPDRPSPVSSVQG